MKFFLAAALCLFVANAGACVHRNRSVSRSLPGKPAAMGDRGSDTISGRVTDSSGQPINKAIVYFSSASHPQDDNRSAGVDKYGRFIFSDVPRGVYHVWAVAMEYVATDEDAPQLAHRAGDTVDIALTRGGAITGSVRGAANQPMTGLTVQAIRIRDKYGRAVADNRSGILAEVDDRGIYRIFGVQAGTYIVMASGRSPYTRSPSASQTTGYQNDIPTYYPSSTRDTAQTVTVQADGEVRGIDIRYRGEHGHAIGGKVRTSGLDLGGGGITVQLYSVASHSAEAAAVVLPGSGENGFTFYGLADGDYRVSATTGGNNADLNGGIGRASVSVKGVDATGIEVSMVPYGSVAGTVVIESPGKDAMRKCGPRSRLALEELIIRVRRDGESEDAGAGITGVRQVAPSASGEFTLPGLAAGQYHLEIATLGDEFFVRNVTVNVPGKPPTDADQAPLAVKPGEHRNGLTVNIAEGAAALAGHVVSPASGDFRLGRLRVALVPADKEGASDARRFVEVGVRPDGSFSFTGLAPGRYFVIARPATDDESDVQPRRPLPWDASTRAFLLKEVAANPPVELRTCERRMDYQVKLSPNAVNR